MKKLLALAVMLVFPLFTYAIRIINESNTEITIHTYNVGDMSYWSPRDIYVLARGASRTFVAHDNKQCKLQLWSSSNGQLSTRRLAPGRIFRNTDRIILNEDFTFSITPEGTTPLEPHPNSVPNPPTNLTSLQEGQGFAISGSIVGSNKSALVLEGGRLMIKNPAGETCFSFVETNVKYVMLMGGYLFLYNDNPNGGFTVIKRFGNDRPGAELVLQGKCGVKIRKRFFTEWSMSDQMMPAKP